MRISFGLKSTFKLFNAFLIIGILLQIGVWLWYGESWLSLISGVAGVIGVVWVSQKRLIAYWPCFIQLGTYLWLAVQQKLWGEVGENIFYFVTMLIGLVMWYRNSGSGLVFPRSLGWKGTGWIMLVTVVGVIGLWYSLSLTSDTQPALDAVTTVPAIVAQILMITRYREQWIFWLIIDVFSVVMWWNAGDMCMVLQFIFWTANCLYGLWKWK